MERPPSIVMKRSSVEPMRMTSPSMRRFSRMRCSFTKSPLAAPVSFAMKSPAMETISQCRRLAERSGMTMSRCSERPIVSPASVSG